MCYISAIFVGSSTNNLSAMSTLNKIDLTTAAEGTMILTPWGKDADRRPVSFTSIGQDVNDDDELVYCISYVDENGDQFCVFADDQFATAASI